MLGSAFLASILFCNPYLSPLGNADLSDEKWEPLSLVCFAFVLEVDQYGMFFQGRYQLLVIMNTDNRYLEPIFVCSKNYNVGVKNLNRTNTVT